MNSKKTENYRSSVKGDKIPLGLMTLLNLSGDEEILFHKKLNLFTQQLKNGERVVRKHLGITTSNLIILDYYSFHIRMPKSWRERDVIPLSAIIAVEGKMKEFYATMRPFLIIRTIHGNIYEIVFSTFGEYIAEINEIAVIIKRVNSQVRVDMNLSEPYWKYYLSGSITWRMLLLVIFLMIIVYMAIWQPSLDLKSLGVK